MKKVILLYFAIISLQACVNKNIANNSNQTNREVTALAKNMSGTFSSAAQAGRDSAFYDISLVMYPIWEEDEAAEWLYVEQAVSEYKDQPYRQRIYRLAKVGNEIESRVYELANPEDYIHAWKNPALFDQLKPDDLLLRDGCSVFMKPIANNCYEGSTRPNACGSSLRGATYATSEVRICEDGIVSWDRGWNEEGEQVWGAETEGYVFDKLESSVF